MQSTDSGKESRGRVQQLQDEVAALRASRRRIAEAAHGDRRAIEREFHDGIQQDLAAIAVELQRLDRLLDGEAGAARALLAELSGVVREALDETRTLATRIYPNLLEGRGFATALRSAASSAGVTAVVDAPPVAGYPPEITAALYWTWTEALASAPDGSKATIHIADSDGGLTFDIMIDGPHREGRLDRLRDRIEAFDGRASIDGPQRGGSRLQGWLPLPR